MEGDARHLLLDPGAGHRRRGPLGEGANGLQPLALLRRGHHRVLGRVLQPVAPDQAQAVGPRELLAEVVQAPTRHHGHRDTPGHERGQDISCAGHQGSLVGAGRER